MVGYCTVSSCSFEGTLKQHVKAGEKELWRRITCDQIITDYNTKAVSVDGYQRRYKNSDTAGKEIESEFIGEPPYTPVSHTHGIPGKISTRAVLGR
ncbi:unnamed protein product, partial [Porites evermanni]